MISKELTDEQVQMLMILIEGVLNELIDKGWGEAQLTFKAQNRKIVSVRRSVEQNVIFPKD